MMKIEKKCWPDYFEKVLRNEKQMDLRIADFEVGIGDILVLKEWDPKTKQYTGRIIERKIKYVMKTKNAEKLGMYSKEDVEKYGFVIMSLE